VIRKAAALALVVVLNCNAGFAVVGDSVSTDAREELAPYGATVLANGGVDIVRGRPAIRELAHEGRRRLVIELGLMDVGFWSSAADLRRRVRAVMRDDVAEVPCVIWFDLVTWSRRNQPLWPERATQFNDLLGELGERYGVHVAPWSRRTRGHRDWFRLDGIHPNAVGQRAFARYVDGRVDALCGP
jgi:hypothetical protein